MLIAPRLFRWPFYCPPHLQMYTKESLQQTADDHFHLAQLRECITSFTEAESPCPSFCLSLSSLSLSNIHMLIFIASAQFGLSGWR